MADSCHVLESLIFMMLGRMGEKHTDGIPMHSLYCYISILAHDCYIFIFKGLINQVILYSHIYLYKKINALIFLIALNFWAGFYLNEISKSSQ